MNSGNKMWLLLISVPAFIGIIFIIFYSTREIPAPPPRGPGEARIYERMIPAFLLWFATILAILVVVPLSYYLVSRKLDEKLEKNMKIILKLMDKGNSIPKMNSGELGQNIVLKLLNGNQRKVLERLVENEGAALQSEIGRMEGMTRLKTHRAIKDLENKGIIRTENFGKTNRILLTEDFKEILLK